MLQGASRHAKRVEVTTGQRRLPRSGLVHCAEDFVPEKIMHPFEGLATFDDYRVGIIMPIVKGRSLMRPDRAPWRDEYDNSRNLQGSGVPDRLWAA